MTYEFKKPDKKRTKGGDGSDFDKARRHEHELFMRDTDGEFSSVRALEPKMNVSGLPTFSMLRIGSISNPKK